MRNSSRVPSSGKVLFVYEDESIIVVEKPVGLPVISPEGSRAKSVLDLVTLHVQRRNPKGRAAVVHRLDRDTSGIMVFARDGRAKKVLMDNWDALVYERGYIALAEGVPDAGTLKPEAPGVAAAEGGGTWEGVFEDFLLENQAGQVYVASPQARGSLRALTRWKLLSASGSGGKGTGGSQVGGRGPGMREAGASSPYCLFSLSLETGRKHQIRVQLSSRGYPVAGDARYGARSDPLGRLCLHAAVLGLEHPFTRERFSFESPAPDEFYALASPRRLPNPR
jgi:23S rRNA pseudouridine1911/1915/1917 synthase